MNIYGAVEYQKRGEIRVLVPGAGLGRLVYEGTRHRAQKSRF